MDGDPTWDNRHIRFLAEVYAGDELEVEYSISDKKGEGNSERYGILSIDVQIKRINHIVFAPLLLLFNVMLFLYNDE
ncbi:MAG: hypothetical protein ACJ71I_15540 [Nitrososphaeraceae archaeon]